MTTKITNLQRDNFINDYYRLTNDELITMVKSGAEIKYIMENEFNECIKLGKKCKFQYYNSETNNIVVSGPKEFYISLNPNSEKTKYVFYISPTKNFIDILIIYIHALRCISSSLKKSINNEQSQKINKYILESISSKLILPLNIKDLNDLINYLGRSSISFE